MVTLNILIFFYQFKLLVKNRTDLIFVQDKPIFYSSTTKRCFSSIFSDMLKSPATESRRVRTLYACVGEHDTELSFEPNQIITSSKYFFELIHILGQDSSKWGSEIWPFKIWTFWRSDFKGSIIYPFTYVTHNNPG